MFLPTNRGASPTSGAQLAASWGGALCSVPLPAPFSFTNWKQPPRGDQSTAVPQCPITTLQGRVTDGSRQSPPPHSKTYHYHGNADTSPPPFIFFQAIGSKNVALIIISTVLPNIEFFLHTLEYFLSLHTENTKYDEWSSMERSGDNKSDTKLSKK